MWFGVMSEDYIISNLNKIINMAIQKYKQRCFRCKENWVLVTGRQRFVFCYDCQKKDLKKEIKDPKMKKLFDIPEKYYKENTFLRSIKINYIQYEKLTERQIEAFKKVVKKVKEDSK